MHVFEYRESWKQLLTPRIVSLLIWIHEAKGKQKQMLLSEGDALLPMKEEARVQSIRSSNGIEGIRVREEKFKPLVADKVIPKGMEEEMLAGYREAIQYISDSYVYHPMTPTYIIQIHQTLFKYTKDEGGRFRSSECGQAVDRLCCAYDDALQSGADPLLIIPSVVLDFLNIEPFDQGNRQMSRLMLLHLLCRVGYGVGRYVSIEHIIEQRREEYDHAYFGSSMNWGDNLNDYKGITEYLLEIIESAYESFFPKAEKRMRRGYTKLDYTGISYAKPILRLANRIF